MSMVIAIRTYRYWYSLSCTMIHNASESFHSLFTFICHSTDTTDKKRPSALEGFARSTALLLHWQISSLFQHMVLKVGSASNTKLTPNYLNCKTSYLIRIKLLCVLALYILLRFLMRFLWDKGTPFRLIDFLVIDLVDWWVIKKPNRWAELE